MKKLLLTLCGLCLPIAFSGGVQAQTITNQPKSLTVNNASTAFFSVGASNAVSYQWRLNGTNLVDTSNPAAAGSISGSLTPALTLDNVTSNQAGTYTVVINSNLVSDSNAVLTVVPGTVVTFDFSGLLTNTPGSNLVVQLFDHDKPVTVANFLHYIRAGGYSNMFMDRCLPGFVLQGGDDGATDRTNTEQVIIGWDIHSEFVTAGNNYPPQVVSEFGVGPTIHNRFGTLAMALGANQATGVTLTNSATSAFFFNLADNSGPPNNLDTTNNGPFTVFGRVMSGTNLLGYFNSLTNGGIVGNDSFYDVTGVQAPDFQNLPVNYIGSALPANSNLVFCDFSITNAPVDTNPPTVSITFPAPNIVLTNGHPLIQGTASDDVGVAVVICTLIPQAAEDGQSPNYEIAISTNVEGTNWSVSITNGDNAAGLVPPGVYTLEVQSQDGSGNLSPAVSQTLTITAVVTNGNGTVTFNDSGTNVNAVGYPFQDGVQYTLTATPATNGVFLDWSTGVPIDLNPQYSFTMNDGVVLTANFASNGIPNGLAITYPVANSLIGNGFFSINGTISNALAQPVVVTCQLYSQTTQQSVGLVLTNTGSGTNFSFPVATNLPFDSYDVQVVATDANGKTAIGAENFTIAPTLQLTIVGPGTVSPIYNGELITNHSAFVATALTNQNALFEFWSNGATIYTNAVITNVMTNGLDLTAVFVTNTMPNTIAISFPPANGLIGTNSLSITGTYSNVAMPPVTLTGQIYSGSSLRAVGPPLTNANASSNWSIPVNTNLSAGTYFLELVAVDSAGHQTLTNESFTVAPTLVLNIVGPGTVSGVTNGELIVSGASFQATADPGSNALFYLWTSNTTEVFTNAAQSFKMPSNGLNLTATFFSNSIPNSVAITYPPANAIVPTNLPSISGTIAAGPTTPVTVTCQIYSRSSFLAVGGPLISSSNLTNWSVTVTNNLAPGGYFVEVTAVDSAGNSTETNENFTAEAYGTLYLNIVGPGAVSGVTNGQLILVGTTNSAIAAANSGQLFYSWANGSQISYNPTQTFVMPSSLTLTATFVSNSVAISNDLAFTYPASNAIIAPATFNITGTISNASMPVLVTVQLYSATTYTAVGPALTNGGVTNNWSVTVTNPAAGSYIAVAEAVDAASNSTLISENFTVGTNSTLYLTIVGPGTVSPVTNGQTILIGTRFQVVGTPAAGQFFASWVTNGNSSYASMSPTQYYTMSANLSLTANFVSNNQPMLAAFTSPPSNGVVGIGGPFEVSGTVSNTSSSVTIQIFSTSNLQAVTSLLYAPMNITNWGGTITNALAPGEYTIEAIATDTNGDSTMITNNFTVSTHAPLTVVIVGDGTTSLTNGALLPVGTNFTIDATANAGSAFYAWNNGSIYSIANPESNTMANNLTLTAVFASNSMPGMITFTSPPPNGIVGTGAFQIGGAISNVPYAQVTFQIFGQTNGYASPVFTTNGTTSWGSSVAGGLPVGPYTILATGTDEAGDSSFISENFTVASNAVLGLNIIGQGTVSPVTNGQIIEIGSNFQVTATPAPGQVFYTWNNGTVVSTNAKQTFTMSGGLTLTATFVPSNTPKGITFTAPAPKAILTTNTFPIKGRISSLFKRANITCQIFQTNGVAVGPPMTTTASTTWSVIASNVPGGIYTVEAVATNSTGYAAIASENFSVQAFAAAKGTYTGLFICTNATISPTNSGFLTFTISGNGLASGRLAFPAYAAVPIYSLPFENVEFTLGYAAFRLANFHGQPLAGTINLDLSGGTGSAYGTIFSGSNWSSTLYCTRAVTRLGTNTLPVPGKYVFNLQSGTNGPYTNGYAAVVAAKNGTLAVSGALPDNTAFSESARVSDGGIWPLYVVPGGDGSKGVLMGWETFTNGTSSTGQLYWYKAANVGAYYTSGVGVASNWLFNASGTNFSRPSFGPVYSMVFQGGSLPAPITNFLSIDNSGDFVVTGSPANKLKVALTANGVLSGSFINVSDNKTLHFKGAFTSPSQGGSGFIPDASGQTGSFSLQLLP